MNLLSTISSICLKNNMLRRSLMPLIKIKMKYLHKLSQNRQNNKPSKINNLASKVSWYQFLKKVKKNLSKCSSKINNQKKANQTRRICCWILTKNRQIKWTVTVSYLMLPYRPYSAYANITTLWSKKSPPTRTCTQVTVLSTYSMMVMNKIYYPSTGSIKRWHSNLRI